MGTVEDEISQYDVSIILGVTTTLQGKAWMGLGQYGLLEGFSKKNLGAGMANGMLPVNNGLLTVGAIRKGG